MRRERWRWSREHGALYQVGVDDPDPRARLHIIGDIDPYLSPVTGEVVRGRAQRREDMKRHDCIDARDGPSPAECEKIRSEQYEKGWKENERYIGELFGDR